MKRSSTTITTTDQNPRPKKFTTKNKSRQALGIQSQIHKPLRTIKPELKWKDTNYTASVPPFGTWTTPQLLNGLAIGGSPNQRVGRKCNFTKLLVRGQFTASTVTVPESDTRIRVLVVYDKQANGTAALTANILASDSFNAAMNLDNRDRFIILADQEVEQSVGKNNFTGTITFNRKFNCETIYNANGAGDAGDIQTGAIYIMWCGADESFGTPILSTVRTRIRFVDF